MALSKQTLIKERNEKLKQYFTNHVQLKREETTDIVGKVIPEVHKILEEIHRLDNRFRKNPVYTGSTYQGLKVRRADEYDFSIVLEGIGDVEWDLGDERPRYYSFVDPSKNEKYNLDEDWEIVKSSKALPKPATGYRFIRLGENSQYSDLMCDGDLIPHLVKSHFKKIFLQAVENLQLESEWTWKYNMAGSIYTGEIQWE